MSDQAKGQGQLKEKSMLTDRSKCDAGGRDGLLSEGCEPRERSERIEKMFLTAEPTAFS